MTSHFDKLLIKNKGKDIFMQTNKQTKAKQSLSLRGILTGGTSKGWTSGRKKFNQKDGIETLGRIISNEASINVKKKCI